MVVPRCISSHISDQIPVRDASSVGFSKLWGQNQRTPCLSLAWVRRCCTADKEDEEKI